MSKAKVAVGTLALALALAAPAAGAPTDSPILIRSFSPALSGETTAEYVMLQMTVDGQQHVAGRCSPSTGRAAASPGPMRSPPTSPSGRASARSSWRLRRRRPERISGAGLQPHHRRRVGPERGGGVFDRGLSGGLRKLGVAVTRGGAFASGSAVLQCRGD